MSTTHHTGNTATTPARLPWVAPTLRAAGRLGDVLKGGQGKVTIVTGDPGEPQKVPSLDK